jgi:predicted transglutaminase-like cysteine proteinase
LLIPFLLSALNYPQFSNEELKKVAIINPLSKKRIVDYQKNMQVISTLSKKKQLQEVNFYLNGLLPQYDAITNNKEDVWATPKEFLTVGCGDCEDYAIIKYYSLIHLGFDEKKLFLTIVQDKYTSGYHMVLSYFHTPKSSPLVLDNLSFRILPLEKRVDLKPLLFFNSTGVYKLKNNELIKTAPSYKRFSELQKKIEKNL